MWKTTFKKIEVIWSVHRPYHFKFHKGCLPQILLGPFLNTLFQMFLDLLKFLGKLEISSEAGWKRYAEVVVLETIGYVLSHPMHKPFAC